MRFIRFTVISILTLSAFLAGCGQKAYESVTEIPRTIYEKEEYQKIAVGKGDMEPVLKMSLTRHDTEKISYSVDEEGLELEELMVGIGDHVSEGQLLITFKSEDIKKNIEKYSGEVIKKQLLLDHYKRMYNVDFKDRDEKYAVILEELEDDVNLAKLYLEEEQERNRKCQVVAQSEGTVSYISNKVLSGLIEPGENLLTQICGQTQYTANTKDSFDFEVGDIYQAVDGEENYDMKVVEIIDESDFSRTVVFEPVDVTTDLSSAAYMEIKKGKLPGVVYLPTRAINVKVDSTFVYVVKENGFLEGRYVELGEEIGDLVVIKSGLDGTEEVAVKE